MIAGNNYAELFKCDYLDANTQGSSDMNLKCIKDKSQGEAGLCTSSYNQLYDNIAINSENINIKRGMNAGFGILPNNEEKNKVQSFKPDSESSVGNNVEGFSNNVEGFTTDAGMGEKGPFKGCPVGYKWCSKTKACVQVCTSCKYKDRMKSLEFNEADKCFPNGVYDGVGSDGQLKCTCGKDNRYCSDKYLDNIFSTEGSIYSGNNIKNFGSLFN